MLRLIFLIAAILLAVLLFWGISFFPKKKLNLDLFCLVNVLLYFALSGSTYIFIADEELGLFFGNCHNWCSGVEKISFWKMDLREILVRSKNKYIWVEVIE
ncbi:MAG: hypothetical protein ACJ0BI_06270 [Paracoccaceae bacterium]